MYPFESLRTAWDEFYSAVAGGVLGAPDTLRWDLDAPDTWLSPQLTIGMACGWPLVTELRDRVRVIGTFAYDIGGASSHTYRSVIVARDAATVADLAHRTLAFNSTDSMSGYVSAISALAATATSWPGPMRETGAHLASVEAVRGGLADIASIDALTWAYTQRDAPEMLQGLVIIDRGPEVPHLPLIAGLETSDAALTEWRTALAEAVHDPALAGPLGTLLIQGFVALGMNDYERALAPLRHIGVHEHPS